MKRYLFPNPTEDLHAFHYGNVGYIQYIYICILFCFALLCIMCDDRNVVNHAP